jgi:dihydroorotase
MGELSNAGAIAFSDDDRPVADSGLMRHALEYSRLFDRPIINHCQDLPLSKGAVMNEGVVSIRLGLRGMPAAAEETMVARDLALAELTGGRLHIAHVSTVRSVELIRRAKAQGIPVTAEATPHHLTLTEDWVMGHERWGQGLTLDAYDTNAKVNPPLRTEADRRAVVEGLRDGTIDIIATDHAPHDSVSKLCEFDDAAFGISVLETAVGSLMELVHRGELDFPLIIEKLTAAPARILSDCVPDGLGSLQMGAPADIVLIDPEAEWEVEPDDFASKGKNTPLAGTMLRGRVVATLAGGQMAYQADSISARKVGK